MPSKPLSLLSQFQDSSLLSHEELLSALARSQELLLRHQFNEGYWWYTLEANETIGAEYILLREFLGITDVAKSIALCQRILSQQRQDGSWALYYDGPGDLSTTVECYWALKLSGFFLEHPAMTQARSFILKNGGPTKVRVFTKIHLAMFGLAPWRAVPAMPYILMMLPNWAPINIYEFSSWARACIVPLLVILNEKPIHPLKIDLEELYPEKPQARDWSISVESPISLSNIFIIVDKVLKNIEKIKIPRFTKANAVKRCLSYIQEHIEKTEDIYPAMAYSAMALKTLGIPLQDPTLEKCLRGLEAFQQVTFTELPAIPQKVESSEPVIHQQCCVSPVWDTPWAAVSLIESGLPKQHPALQKSVDWLISKQIRHTYGDWAIKNKKGKPGGWSFEFENDYFPDVDDTIEVLTLFHKVGLNDFKTQHSFDLGLQWLLSMQSRNGGWAAFDIDNDFHLINRIPFSDHGACLDPPTPDITGRMLEFLALIGFKKKSVLSKALRFIYREQLDFGAWEGRWGVHFIYGTWCVLQGLAAIGEDLARPEIQRAVDWLLSVQNADGGWGESCDGYMKNNFVPLYSSVPSQTAWALMGLIAAGRADSLAVKRGIDFLIERQNVDGSWDEKEYTGTGFPGHFYIRYHGYRHYFPLLALGKYRQAVFS